MDKRTTLDDFDHTGRAILGFPPLRRAPYLTLVRWVVAVVLVVGMVVQATLPAAAQEEDPPVLSRPLTMRFAHLTAEDGLSHNAVTAVLQDSHGFMWIGTQDGLNRFDGYRFTTYRYEPEDPHSLSNSHVRAIAEDAEGALWIATQGGGLNRFDPHTETFTRYRRAPHRALAPKGDTLFAVFRDSADNLWIGGAPSLGLEGLDAAQVAALAAEDPVTPTFHHHPLDPVPSGEAAPGLFRGGVQEIVEGSQGRLWLAADLALVSLEPETGAMTAYVPHPEERRLNTIVRDAGGDLWVGGNTGLHKFDTAAGRFVKHLFDFEVEALYVGGETLWVGGPGLYVLDLRTEEVTQRYVQERGDPHALLGEVVTAIYEDAGGVLWIGTSDGLNTFDPRQRQFTHYRHHPNDDSSLADDQVQAIAGDPSGKVWLATPQVLELLDPATGEVTPYFPETGGDPFPGVGMSALLLDREGDLWIGVGDRLYRFPSKAGDFELYDTLRDRAHPGPPPSVSAIVEDWKGDVWIAMTLVGLHRFDRQSGTFHTYLPERSEADASRGMVSSPQTIISDRPSALHVDRGGDVWIGYRDGVLSHYSSTTGTFTHYAPGSPAAPSSAGDGPSDRHLGWIEAIYEDAAGFLWLATRSGLIRFDPSTALGAGVEEGVELGSVRRYTERDGLPTSYVVSILPEGGDHGRYLWLGTAKGLSRFDPHTETFDNFDVADGLGGNVFNPGAAWKAPGGRMYFGGTHGLTAFDSGQVTLRTYDPPVLLTELRLANEPVDVGTDSLLTRPVWDAERLTLRYDDDIVSFEFAALDYAAPHKLRYRYRLEGLEKDWVVMDSGHRFATYTHLPAGSYTFRVQGTNASGVWSEDEARLALTVLPPWWETWWFRGGLFLFVTALLGSVVHWRIHDIRRRNVELKALVADRTAELADEKARVEDAHAVLRTVLDNLDALIYVADMESYEILFANALTQETFGEVEGLICWQVLQEGQPGPCSFCSNSSLLAPDGSPTGICRWQFRNERTGRWYTVADSAIEWIDGRRVRLSMAADITDHKEAEQRLLAQQRLVAALDERERIGRELHDDLGQVMGYVNAQAQAAQELLRRGRHDQVQASLRQLAEVAQEAHADVRRYILGVRTSADRAPRDFLTALERYLQQLEERYNLIVRVNWPKELRESPLASQVETQLLRIIQEALTNVRKHAGVDAARLMFTLHPNEIQVVITDEGRGFDVTQALSKSYPASRVEHRASSFGLTIMRERAERVGGKLEVQSRPGAGTQVIVQLPRTLESRPGVRLRGLRVLLADDHDLYLQGLRNLLSARGINVVGLAHDGLEVQELAAEYLPDLILMDVEMPNCDGLEATRRIKAELPGVRVVMLTVAADEDTLLEALKCGADGYLLKDLESRQFFELLCGVMREENVLSPTLASRVLKELTEDGAFEEPDTSQLTSRQREVLELVAQGMTNREVAQRLFISPDTVKYHVSQILERLQVQSRYELAQFCDTETPRGGDAEGGE